MMKYRNYVIDRLVISTYQSVSGTGVKAMEQMINERAGVKAAMVYPYPIDMNCLPHGGDFEENGYTTEETKLVNETRKILGDKDIRITATVVRIPVFGGHSEAVNVATKREFKIDEIKDTNGGDAYVEDFWSGRGQSTEFSEDIYGDYGSFAAGQFFARPEVSETLLKGIKGRQKIGVVSSINNIKNN